MGRALWEISISPLINLFMRGKKFCIDQQGLLGRCLVKKIPLSIQRQIIHNPKRTMWKFQNRLNLLVLCQTWADLGMGVPLVNQTWLFVVELFHTSSLLPANTENNVTLIHWSCISYSDTTLRKNKLCTCFTVILIWPIISSSADSDVTL